MLDITLNVTYTDGRETSVRSMPPTIVAFEREHNCSIATIATEQKMSHIYWLAWHASRPGVGFDEWLDAVESIDVEVAAAAPLPQAVSAGM